MFVVKKSQAISISASATKLKLNNLLNGTSGLKGGINPDVAYRRASHIRIVNTHASQLLYWKRGGATITTSNAEGVIGVASDRSQIIPLQNIDEIQLIASGASTTGYLEFGSPD